MDNIPYVLSGFLAFIALAALVGGLLNRHKLKRGIGWQFIRYVVLTISLPIVGILALNNALSAEAATLIGTAMGFAFGKTSEQRSGNRKSVED
jgi:biotin transporter BioY